MVSTTGLLLLVVALTAVTSGTIASLIQPVNGPKAFHRVCAGACMCVLVLGFLSALSEPHQYELIGWLTAASELTVIVIFEIARAMMGGRMRHMRAMSHEVKRIGLQRFAAELANGVVSSPELEEARDDPQTSVQMRAVIQHMIDHIKLIGHVTETIEAPPYPPRDYKLSSHQFGEMVPLPEQAQDVYGISREDLNSYPDRLRQRYAAWYAVLPTPNHW